MRIPQDDPLCPQCGRSIATLQYYPTAQQRSQWPWHLSFSKDICPFLTYYRGRINPFIRDP